MDEARHVGIDLHAPGQHLLHEGGGSQPRQQLVGFHRHQQPHVQAAPGRRGQRGQDRFVRNEVGRGDPDPPACRRYGGKEVAVDGVLAAIRAGIDDLHPGLALVAGLVGGQREPGQNVLRRGQCLVQPRQVARARARIQPVLQEDPLQVQCRAALERQVRVARCGRPHTGNRLDPVHVDAAREAIERINDHDLAVGSEVHHAGPERQETGRIEDPHLTAGLAQRLPEIAAAAPGAHRIHQHPNLHAGTGLLGEQVAPAGADLVRLEDVVLHMDVVLGLLHRRLDGGVGGIAIDQDLQPLHLARRCAAALGGQPCLGQQPVARGQRLGQRLGAVRTVVRRQVAGQLAADIATLELAGAEEEIAQQAEHRQAEKGQDPRQRGQRRPPLPQQEQDAAHLQHRIQQHPVRDRDALPDELEFGEQVVQEFHGRRREEGVRGLP